MKAILIYFDSLNRRHLAPYGCSWIQAPNFTRVAQKCITFDRAFVGSMPCIPARRELHTGRYNFLHHEWGPIEPYDDSMPELLKNSGVHTHLVTDHIHYFEDGGATYHTRYNTWEFFRGRCADPWKGQVREPEIPPHKGWLWRQEAVNRQYMKQDSDWPVAQTFSAGLDFIRTNKNDDRWFLQIETFDPHEPFYAPQRFRDLYPKQDEKLHFDWPEYRRVNESPEEIEHCLREYASAVSHCDEHLGRVLDLMDAENLWEDTMLIVTSDHGFLMGEHEWWAKCIQPFYNEVATIPLFVWDPRRPNPPGTRCQSLVQTIDLAPTLMEFFNVSRPDDMRGIPVGKTTDPQAPVRESGLFGQFSGHVCVTDGRYVYMRAPVSPDNQPLHYHTLMPTHMLERFSPKELHTMTLANPFSFTKGCQVMKIRAETPDFLNIHKFGHLLFDIESDPAQEKPLQNPAIENLMIQKLIRLMRENDAPAEQYQRLGLNPASVSTP